MVEPVTYVKLEEERSAAGSSTTVSIVASTIVTGDYTSSGVVHEELRILRSRVTVLSVGAGR